MAKLTISQDSCLAIDKLIKSGCNNREISDRLGISKSLIAQYCRRVYGGNKNFKRCKHKHLREEVLLFFLNNSFEETAKKFNLKKGELKSLFTAAYKDTKFKHLRKEKRINHKNFWTIEEIRQMLNLCGIKSRKEISIILKRGNERVIKEKLSKLGISSRNINGLNISVFRQFFNCEPEFLIESTAGPTSINKKTCFKIVPWIKIDEWIKSNKIKTVSVFEKLVEIYAMFQRWRGFKIEGEL